MIAVAVTVCGFAVGMAGLLNFFKYRSTANRVVTERLVVTGKAVENSIQSALSLGLQFSEIGTLQTTLDRERAADPLILGIDVFDTDGKPLYSTDRLRATRPAPPHWMDAAHKMGAASGSGQWTAEDEFESAAGIALKNNFELTIGYLAVRYSGERVREAAYGVGRELALTALGVFVLAAALASAAVVWVTRGLARDLKAVEDTLRRAAENGASLADPSHAAPTSAALNGAALNGTALNGTALNDPALNNPALNNPALSDPALSGNFGKALRHFLRSTQGAERRAAAARAHLHPGGNA
jgi:hypothetical protein